MSGVMMWWLFGTLVGSAVGTAIGIKASFWLIDRGERRRLEP